MDGTEHVYDPADRLIGPTEVMILSNPTGWKFGSMGPMELGELTDTSKMTSLSELFAYGNCIGDTTDFNAWDMSNVTSIFSMFDSNMPMEQFICPDWDLRKCTNLTASIPKVKTAGKTDLSNWKLNTTEDVTMMSMFYFYKQLTGLDLSKWDTSRVTAMNMLFYKSDFDGDISSWCVQNISSEPPGFADNTPLAEAPEKNPKWGQAC
jgi:surface protein